MFHHTDLFPNGQCSKPFESHQLCLYHKITVSYACWSVQMRNAGPLHEGKTT